VWCVWCVWCCCCHVGGSAQEPSRRTGVAPSAHALEARGASSPIVRATHAAAAGVAPCVQRCLRVLLRGVDDSYGGRIRSRANTAKTAPLFWINAGTYPLSFFCHSSSWRRVDHRRSPSTNKCLRRLPPLRRPLCRRPPSKVRWCCLFLGVVAVLLQQKQLLLSVRACNVPLSIDDLTLPLWCCDLRSLSIRHSPTLPRPP
jgi:hypothetical protein